MIVSLAKGPVNLVKESRVYLKRKVGSLKCLMQGRQIRFALQKNCFIFRVEIGLGEGT